MPVFVALLRSVNVSGRNRLPMEELRALVSDAGFGEVRTYVQSGNVVCTGRGSAATAARAIEERMAERLGWSVPVVVRTKAELGAVLGASPFAGEGLDQAKLHVTFLAGAPDPAGSRRLAAEADRFGDDRAVVLGREVYLHCPAGYGRSKLDNAFLERRLGAAATTRNWRTVTTLAGMAGIGG